jgi:hypothetical protein
MEATSRKPPKFWPFALGGCLLFVLICGATIAFGAGGLLWFTHSGGRVAVQNSPSSSQLSPDVAELTGLQGGVAVQEQGGWFPASEGQLLHAGQRVRTNEMSSVALRFYDGSQASLGPASELSIDQLNAGQGNKTRTIVMTQWSGQSEHQVAKNGRKDSRYVVNSAAGTGQAQGTLFRVSVTPEGEARYAVVEGSVAVTGLDVTVVVHTGQVTTIFLGHAPLEPVLSASAQGVITQMGSIWVIAGQSFAVDEHTLVIGDLQVGDWALVEGRRLDDGSRIADWIILIHTSPANHFNLNGEVDTIGDTEWTINDQKIYVTSQTEIDPGIAAGDLVRAEGLILEDGRLEAESIRLQESNLGLPFEFSGVVQEMNTEDWLISGRSVHVTAQTAMPADLSSGELVQVSGRILDDQTWLATNIVRVDEQSGYFEFTGELQSMDPWQVAGISFETRDWTVIAPGLKPGDLVVVKGEIDTTGSWIAEEIVPLDAEAARMVLIGTVVSTDPWIVSGVSLRVTGETIIQGEISVGSLVRVELVLGDDGLWYALRIEPLPGVIASPGCIDLVAKVISVEGNQIQLENWPWMPLDENIQVEGVLTPGSIVRFRLCFDADGQITIVYIVIIEQTEIEPQSGLGGKVLVCHKPNQKKGGHTLSIDAAALPAHLGHGDYPGPCQ